MSKDLQAMIESANSNNIFMQCDAPNPGAFRPLPAGFSFRLCRRDELDLWKRMWAQGQYMEFVNDCYAKVYAPHADEFFRRCTFAVDGGDSPVATGYIWRSYGRISTLGWYHVLPAYEGRGIGRALLGKLLQSAAFPVYVHTHPTATRAIKLYSDFGFKAITDPVIGYRKNDWAESLAYLKEALPEADFASL